jgi:hypothetical protein
MFVLFPYNSTTFSLSFQFVREANFKRLYFKFSLNCDDKRCRKLRWDHDDLVHLLYTIKSNNNDLRCTKSKCTKAMR